MWPTDPIKIMECRRKMSLAQKKRFQREKNPMEGRHLSDVAKEKLRKAHLGKKLSEDHKKKLSASRSGEKNWNRGKKMSEAHYLSVLIALFLIGTFCLGVISGYAIGHAQGVEYQKTQPIQISVDTYQNSGTTHQSWVVNVTNEGFVNLWPEYVPNFTFYKITKYRGV
jgi:hypothetical protein